MITWVNQNQGFILSILTLVYVVSTIVQVYLTRRSIHQIQQLERARIRPVVIFNMEIREKIVHAFVRNVGQSPAINITIKTNPVIMTGTGSKERECVITQKPIPFLASGQEIDDVLGASPLYDKLYNNATYKGTISYADAGNGKYDESFDLGLWHQMNRWHTSTKHEDLLTKAVEALEKMASAKD